MLFGALFFSHAFGAANRDVCESGCAYSTIQAALDAAENTDTIRVAQGIYYENDIVVTNPLTVTIQGGWDTSFASRSSDPSLTIVDGKGIKGIFSIYASIDEAISLTMEGITLTNGMAFNGGAIYAYASAGSASTTDSVITLTLNNMRIVKNRVHENGGGLHLLASTYSDTGSAKIFLNLNTCQIIGNLAGINGGGIYVYGESGFSYSRNSLIRLNVTENKINGNTAARGGAIYSSLNDTDSQEGGIASILKANDISSNTAWYVSGGAHLNFYRCVSSAFQCINNVVAGNFSAADAGGVTIESDSSSLSIDFINNTIAGNFLLGLQTFSRGSGGVTDHFVLNFANNIIFGNQIGSTPSDDVELNNFGGGNMVVNASSNSTGSINVNGAAYNDNGGNLTTDPLLGDDFHLLAGSPAINSADATLAPAVDKDGNSRSGAPDRGAYEYLGTDHVAEMPIPRGRYEGRYNAMRTPIVASDPVVARPFTAFIDAADILRLRIDLAEFSSAVDLYAGVFVPTIDPDHVYQIAEDMSFKVSNTPIKWKSGLTTAVKSSLWGDMNVAGWPRGEYFLYLIAVPEGAFPFGPKYYAYHTSFVVE